MDHKKIRKFAARGLSKLSRIIGGENGSGSIDITDDYVTWLCFANAGMLHRGNLYCFDHAIRNLPSDAPIVEIGSFCGLSTNLLTYYKQRHARKSLLITCDKWRFENVRGHTVGESSIEHAQYSKFVKESYVRNIRLFSGHDLPYTIESFSDEFFKAWASAERCSDVLGREIQLGGPISFSYIDGNHSYEFARRDFENCDKYLEPGGFILFDDSQDGSSWEVCRVVAEVKESKRYDLVIKNPNYLFRKK